MVKNLTNLFFANKARDFRKVINSLGLFLQSHELDEDEELAGYGMIDEREQTVESMDKKFDTYIRHNLKNIKIVYLVTGIKPCKTTSWCQSHGTWLAASLPICYFTDFAVSAKS